MPMNIYETPGIENYVKIHLHYYTKVNQKKKDTFENNHLLLKYESFQ